MRKLIFAAIGVLWGGAMTVNGLASGVPSPGNSYGAGQILGLVIGLLLFSLGIWTLVKHARTNRAIS